MRSDRITSLYGSEIECLFSNPQRDVTESFQDATCAHLAGLSDLCEPQHQRQHQCVLSTKIRCYGNGLRLLVRTPSPRTRGEVSYPALAQVRVQ
jgi:hypothetical protein